MNIKQILAGVALLLPFAVTSIPSQASAAVVRVDPHAHHTVVTKIVKKPPVKRKVLIPGHWEKTNHGRKWVAAHYVYR
jgi:hypothetical protein